MSSKPCKTCGEVLDLDEFYANPNTTDKKDHRCKSCSNKHRVFRQKITNLSPERPELCECCCRKTRTMYVDHCHDTMVFRGWICQACNVGIGNLGDNLDGVLKAVAYLSRFEMSQRKDYERTRPRHRDEQETQYDLDLRN